MLILGIDEAGRGPVIGSMFIGAVLIDKKEEKNLKDLGVKDSKLVTPKKRRFLEKEIYDLAEEVHFVEVTASEIDRLRKKMSLNEIEAMKIAELIERFKTRPDHIILDLVDPSSEMFIRRIAKYSDIEEPIKAEHKADVNYPAVAAASIIAKVNRDKNIKQIEKKYGELGSGYPSDERTIDFLKKHCNEDLDIIRYSWVTARRAIEKYGKKQSKLTSY